ncbi:hypothetical protein DYB31_013392, partial [Aphanomyces astaci]
MIYEQLAQFHAQQEAMAKRWEEKSNRQFVMATAVEKNRLEQEVVQVALLQQQEDLSDVTPNIEDYSLKEPISLRAWLVKRERQRAAWRTMGVQQLPLAPKYKGNTKRERCEFMDVYLAYSRRVEVLNRGVG